MVTTIGIGCVLASCLVGQLQPAAEIGLFRISTPKGAAPLRMSTHGLTVGEDISLQPSKFATKAAGQTKGGKRERFMFAAEVSSGGDEEIVAIRERIADGSLELRVMRLPIAANAKKPQWIATTKDPQLGRLDGELPLIAVGAGAPEDETGASDRLMCVRRGSDGRETLDIFGFPVNKKSSLAMLASGIELTPPATDDAKTHSIFTDNLLGSAAEEVLLVRASAISGSWIEIGEPIALTDTAFVPVGFVALPYPATEQILSVTRLGVDSADEARLLIHHRGADGVNRLDEAVVQSNLGAFQLVVKPLQIPTSVGGVEDLAFATGLIRYVALPPEPVPVIAGLYEVWFTGSEIEPPPPAGVAYQGPPTGPIVTIGPLSGATIVQTTQDVTLYQSSNLIAKGPLLKMSTVPECVQFDFSPLSAPLVQFSAIFEGKKYDFSFTVDQVSYFECEGTAQIYAPITNGVAVPVGSKTVALSDATFRKL